MSTKGRRDGEHPGEATLANSPHVPGTRRIDEHPSAEHSIDQHSIDIDAIRDTLRYIESDLRDPRHADLRTILELALMEIGRIESMKPADANSTFGSARFVPAGT